MDSNGGKSLELSSSEKQRLAAQNIARNKVFDSYESNNQASSSEGKLENGDASSLRVSKEEWAKYHTAWQNYYQKYYSNYYSNAARDYIAKEKLKAERNAVETPGPTKPSENVETSISNKLKSKIREKASEQASRAKKRRKIIPILAGLTVVLVFLFLQYNRLIFAPIFAYMSPGQVPESEIEAIDPTVKGGKVGPDPKLIIPKINVDVPVAFGIDANDVMDAMMTGVAHFRIEGASAFPGEIGNTVITGHSAGDVYSNMEYKYIFSGLERLTVGDLIYVNYESIRYTYKITGSKVVEPMDVDALRIPTDKPILTLITCTPLGTSRYRLLVFAEQISPNSEGSKQSSEISSSIKDVMPSNEKTFFERIWSFLTGE